MSGSSWYIPRSARTPFSSSTKSQWTKASMSSSQAALRPAWLRQYACYSARVTKIARPAPTWSITVIRSAMYASML
jgi:hypothetical protein